MTTGKSSGNKKKESKIDKIMTQLNFIKKLVDRNKRKKFSKNEGVIK